MQEALFHFLQGCDPAAKHAGLVWTTLGRNSSSRSEVAGAQHLPVASLCLANGMAERVFLFALAARELRVKFAAPSNSTHRGPYGIYFDP